MKFISKFWHHLWDKFGTYLQFNCVFHPHTMVKQRWSITLWAICCGVFVLTSNKTRKTPYRRSSLLTTAWSIDLLARPLLRLSTLIPHTIVCDMAIMPTVTGGSKGTNNLAKKALQIHAEVWAFLKVTDAKNKAEANKHRHKKVFQEADLVMVHIRHSQFFSFCAKLEKQKYGPFRTAQKINGNAYVIQLPTIGISLTLSTWLICSHII